MASRIEFSLTKPTTAPPAVKKEKKESKFNLFRLEEDNSSSVSAKSAKSAKKGIWKPQTQFVSMVPSRVSPSTNSTDQRASSVSSTSLGLTPVASSNNSLSAPVPRIAGTKPEHLTNLITGTRSALQDGDWKSWTKVCREYGKYFDTINVATALHTASAYLKRGCHRRFINDEENATLVHELVHKFNQEVPFAEPWAIAQSVYSCAKLEIKLEDLNFRHPELFTRISSATRNQINNYNAKFLTCTIWAYARLGKVDRELFLAIANRATTIIDTFTNEDLVLTAWAIAELGIDDEHLDALLEQILTRAENKLEGFDGLQLSTMASAIVKSGKKKENLMTAIARVADQHVRSSDKKQTFEAASLAILAYSMAKAPIPDKALLQNLMKSIGNVVRYKKRDLLPQEIGMLSWAFGMLGIKHDDLIKALSDEVDRQQDDFDPENLASTAWGIAKLGKTEEFGVIARKVKRKIDQFEPHLIAIIAWSFARIKREDDKLLETIAKITKERIREFSPSDLGNIAWCFSVFRWDDEELLRAISGEFLRVGEDGKRKIDGASWETLSEISNALAILRIPHPELMAAIKKRMQELQSECSLYYLAPVGLNFAVYYNACEAASQEVTRDDLDYLYALLGEINSRFQTDEGGAQLDESMCRQINSIILYLGLVRGYQLDPSLYSLRERCSEVLESIEPDPDDSSQSHRQIQKALEDLLGRKLESEFLDEGYPTDILLEYDEDNQIGVDVIGPFHKLRSGKRTGKDLFRLALLKACEWTLLPVEVDDWHKVRNPSQQTEFLKKTVLDPYKAALAKTAHAKAVPAKKPDKDGDVEMEDPPLA